MDCGFQKAWIGPCKDTATEGTRCAAHAHVKCASCGAPATHECDQTGQFVCGAPLCDECEHTIAEDGTNGGIGFFRASPLPTGMKEHCKKAEQKFEPWHAREEKSE